MHPGAAHPPAQGRRAQVLESQASPDCRRGRGCALTRVKGLVWDAGTSVRKNSARPRKRGRSLVNLGDADNLLEECG